jgi:putative ABC transport system ATP-binding protein
VNAVWDISSEPLVAEPLVVVEQLERVYRRGSEEVPVLEEVDLEVGHAEFLALMGPSGSGKSTLLNILGGLDQPSGGLVSIAGERIDQLTSRQLAAWRAEHVGYVFQFYNLFQALTAQANVELPLLLTNLSGRERKQRAAIALSMVGLSHRLRHYPKQLSGGEQQRVGIARAIVTDPTLLLCDEPTGDLDRKSGDEVLNLLEYLRLEHGKTIIMVTHDSHASARATRTVYLNKGRLSEDQPD